MQTNQWLNQWSNNKSNKATIGTGCIASFTELNSSMQQNMQHLLNDCVFGFQQISTKQRWSRLGFQRSPFSTLQQQHIRLSFQWFPTSTFHHHWSRIKLQPIFELKTSSNMAWSSTFGFLCFTLGFSLVSKCHQIKQFIVLQQQICISNQILTRQSFWDDCCVHSGTSTKSSHVWVDCHLFCKPYWQIESWGSVGSSNLLSNFQVDCCLL